MPGGFEPTAWCYLSTVGGTPSSTACGTGVVNPPANGPTLNVNVAAARKPILAWNEPAAAPGTPSLSEIGGS